LKLKTARGEKTIWDVAGAAFVLMVRYHMLPPPLVT